MKKSGLLAALFLALAVPAWAANDGQPRFPLASVEAGQVCEVCVGSGTPSHSCAMKNMSEDNALEVALISLRDCSTGVEAYPARLDAECPLVRAYIKQRWGY